MKAKANVEAGLLEVPELNDEVKVVKRDRKDELAEKTVWYNIGEKFEENSESQDLLKRVFNTNINGVILYKENIDLVASLCSKRIVRILAVKDEKEWASLAEKVTHDSSDKDKVLTSVVASYDATLLGRISAEGFKTCFRIRVNDEFSLRKTYEIGIGFDYVMINFKHTTNIPLELVVAKLQSAGTRVIKETTSNEDALVALGVLEVGADGVSVTASDNREVDTLLEKLSSISNSIVPLQVGVITKTEHLGMGYRSCIDTTTIFNPTEGILLGSTSGGGILCCPEVFYLPYMELRPFRVNAAAVHSYVFNSDDSTSYLSELRAGATVTVVDKSGKARKVNVGRTKTEIRPLLLIEASFDDGNVVNVIMQDDWHVRIFSEKGLPLNVSELKQGDKILGYSTDPGRHVGVKVDEHIVEQ
ncbi:MAG: 3-dehydroquinate synthase [Gammaproteobacteria bacterium]|nr:3-dehydroquinate synthase [Gammaproteobacteria bacterium]